MIQLSPGLKFSRHFPSCQACPRAMFSGRNHMFSLADWWASHSNRKRHLSWHRLQSPLHSLVGRLLRTKAKMQGVTKGRSNWRRRWQGGTGGKKRKLLRKLLWRRSLLRSYCLCFPWRHQQLVFCYWLFWRASMWWVWWENCAHWLEYSPLNLCKSSDIQGEHLNSGQPLSSVSVEQSVFPSECQEWVLT